MGSGSLLALKLPGLGKAMVRRKDMAFSGCGARAFGECQRDLEKAVQYQQIQPDKCCPGLQVFVFID